MSFYSLRQLLAFVFLLGAACVFSQKPMPANALEIKLAPENDTWHLNGKMRILDRTGFPIAIYQADFPVTKAAPELMARQYLFSNRTLLGLTEADLQNLKLHAVSERQVGTTVRLRQVWQNLPVNKNAEITVHITPDNMVNYVMNGFRYGVKLDNVTPSITAQMARQTVINHLGVSGNISGDTQELMVLQQLEKSYLVYRVSIFAEQPLGDWEAYVDAQDGSILKVEDISAYDKDRKKHLEPNLPYLISPLTVVNGTGNTFDPDPLSTANAVYGATGYVDGNDANTTQLLNQQQSRTLLEITLTGSTYSLVGPYAEVRDFEAPNKGLFTQASSAFTFNRFDDAFEAVNCYFHIDDMMRYLNTTLNVAVLPYQYVGGVRFDPSGLSGADNSHYISSSGQIAYGEGGVDDAEDADVIIHELGHGIHDWITSGGLSQVDGLSEGSGDYWAASYSRFKGNWPIANAAYNWVFNWDGHNTFWSGRITNYTAIYPGGLVGQIHTDGQIWATAMMHIWDDIGRQKCDKIFWLGLDMTNGSSSQNDAANAVYQAANTLGCTAAEKTAILNRFTAAGYTIVVAPIELVRFDGQKINDHSDLTWTTANETGNDYFTVERSIDGAHFNSIGKVQGAGNSHVPKSYAFADQNPLPMVNYYRLKQTDFDGNFTYSPIVSLDFSKGHTLEMFPNPTADIITLHHELSAGTILLYDVSGRLVLSQTITDTGKDGSSALSLSGLPTGTYLVRIVSEGKTVEGKVYKQ